MAKVERIEKLERSEKVETLGLLVTLDTPYESIIESEKAGVEVSFSDEVGKFKRLTDDEFKGLGRDNRARYVLAERYYEEAKNKADNPEGVALLGEIRQSARASDRLYVGNKRPDMAYSWKRRDEIRSAIAYDGWTVAKDPKLEVFRRPGGGTPVTGVLGEDELILLGRPKTLHEAHLREAHERSEARRGAIPKQAAADRGLFEEGDPRLDPKGKKWRDIAADDEA